MNAHRWTTSVALFFALVSFFSSPLSASCNARSFNSQELQVVDAYIAYYGRPADAGGLAYWSDRLQRERRLTSIIDSFGDSEEFTSRYGNLGSEQLVRNLYLQLFGRQPDGPGLDYWVGEFESGRKSLQSISLDILAGAQNADRLIIENRNRVARHYLTLAERYPATSLMTESLLANVYTSEEGAAAACGYISALFGDQPPGDSDDYLSYTIGGDASGLQGEMTLKMEYGDKTESLAVRNNGRFAFQTKLRSGDIYSVSAHSQPNGQTCQLSNTFGEVSDHDQTNIKLVCAQNSGKFSISGTIVSAAAIDYDRDVNDPLAPYEANDDFSEAQHVDNVVTIHGFASAEGTWEILEYDRFALYGDEYDVYKTTLQKGQLIQMQVIDYDQFEVDSNYEGDLDLIIFNAQLDPVDGSYSEGEYESLVVPEDGEYYIAVMAYSGISKYVLQLLPPDASQSSASTIAPTTRMDFIPNQMILERDVQTFALQAAANLPQMTLSHQDPQRATLAKIDREAQYLRQIRTASQDGKVAPLSELKALNPEAYAKVMTLIDIKRTRQAPGVSAAEANYLVYPLATPNDEHYPYQWHYPHIQLPQAWDITTGQTGDPVIVAVVDSGILTNHGDFNGKLVDGYDFISDPNRSLDGDGIDSDAHDIGDSTQRGQSSYHGSHVAGTVAARTNDDYGVAGISWGAKIMPLRVLGQGGGTDYDILQAIRYAARLQNDSGRLPAKRADIINMSYGGGAPSTFGQNTYAEARAQGVILVAAAGNSNTDELMYPASYNGIVSVSAVDVRNERAPYSNFGEAIDVAAPGGNLSADDNGDNYPDGVLSALADDTSGTQQPISRFYHGTSMASPHMAGVVALMKSVHPGLTPDDVDTLLANGEITDDIGTRGWDRKFGHGLINAYKAVQAAKRLANSGSPPTQPDPRLAVTPTSLALGHGAVATFSLGNQGGGTLNITGIVPSTSWMTVTQQQTDGNGLGTYQVRVNRSGLTAGTHSGFITISNSSGSDHRLTVTLQVGEVRTQGRVTQQYVLLLEADSFDYVTGALSTETNGSQTFVIEDVPVGTYYLYSSSDIDHDYMPCVSGEVCGAYPSLGSRTTLEVLNQPIRDLRLVVDMLSGLTDRSGAFWVPGEKQGLTADTSKQVPMR